MQSGDIESTTRRPFCKGSLQLARHSSVNLIFCLLTACKNSEGHVYTELGADSRNLLKLESTGEGTPKILGDWGGDQNHLRGRQQQVPVEILVPFFFKNRWWTTVGPHAQTPTWISRTKSGSL